MYKAGREEVKFFLCSNVDFYTWQLIPACHFTWSRIYFIFFKYILGKEHYNYYYWIT